MSDAIKLAIEALQAINPAFICDNAHHAKKDQHGYASECPIVARHEAALAALRAQPDHSELVKDMRSFIELWKYVSPNPSTILTRAADALEGKL